MTFNDFKAYRQTMRPVLEQRKLLQGNEPQYDRSPILFNRDTVEEILRVIFYIVCIVVILLMLCGCGDPAWSAEIPQDKAVHILVGEAANQGFIGMVCVGEVLRHKGSTRGFYGLNAKHSAHEPKWVWNMAKKAWLASKTTNYTKYADHFENLKLDTPYWVKNCIKTFQWKDHIFYKEIA